MEVKALLQHFPKNRRKKMFATKSEYRTILNFISSAIRLAAGLQALHSNAPKYFSY
jgi:hypothetical protein